MTQYFLGQGKVYIASRDAAGKPKAQRWLGDVSAAKLGLKVTKAEQKESYSGQRSTVKSIVIGKEATLDLTLLEISKENLSLALSGKSTILASGSVTGEALPLELVAGDRVSLKYPKVSTVVITDSAATPATLDTAKYDVDTDFGTITFKDITGVTQPLKAAYTHAALASVSMFTKQLEDIFIRYEGINLGEDGVPVVLELYKVNPEPLKDFALITDKFADMAISSSVLIDSSKPADGELGQFGRIIQVAQT
ncbi:hypothetical protein KDM87_14365 [Undibacterium sp. FT147W]|uniref:Phage tail protein n=1 Tax=Undibacterium rivi TaxID=2828729 RepID=A0ABS5H5H4_9BURK|nr:hypothetical protein [Undibacterium rivi]MBR7793780.1 hypothetical protein [Undibacterium rivi]